MGDSFRITANAINIVAGDRLRPGDVISARIRDVLPGNRFRILWNGRTLTAESHLSLKTGQVIRARVEQGAKGFVLRLVDDSITGGKGAGAGTGQAAGIAGRTPAQLLTASFLRASMPLPSDSEITRMANLLSRTRGGRRRLARLQADLVSRGADPSADFLEALDELLDGRRGGEDDSGDPSRRNGPDPAEIRELLKMKEEPLLELVNRATGKREKWTYHRRENLTWKFRRGTNPAMALTVRDGERILEFLLEGRNPARMAVHGSENVEIQPETWDSFRERLSLIHIAVDDTLLSLESSDGFTPGDAE